MSKDVVLCVLPQNVRAPGCEPRAGLCATAPLSRLGRYLLMNEYEFVIALAIITCVIRRVGEVRPPSTGLLCATRDIPLSHYWLTFRE